MDNRAKKLEELEALQRLQNEAELQSRIDWLETTVSSLVTEVTELKRNLTGLQMEFNRDHTRLGAQDAPYRK
jgi:hypothetical protein